MKTFLTRKIKYQVEMCGSQAAYADDSSIVVSHITTALLSQPFNFYTVALVTQLHSFESVIRFFINRLVIHDETRPILWDVEIRLFGNSVDWMTSCDRRSSDFSSSMHCTDVISVSIVVADSWTNSRTINGRRHFIGSGISWPAAAAGYFLVT